MELQQVAGHELVRVRRPAPKPKSDAQDKPSGKATPATAKRGLLARITRR